MNRRRGFQSVSKGRYEPGCRKVPRKTGQAARPVTGTPASVCRSHQEFLQVLLPERGPGVGAMAVSLLGSRDQHKAAVFYPLDLALCYSQLRGVDEIIGGIHEH